MSLELGGLERFRLAVKISAQGVVSRAIHKTS
jgi:hypothetical protein